MGTKENKPWTLSFTASRVKANNTITLEAEKLRREMGLSQDAAMRLARELNPRESFEASRF